MVRRRRTSYRHSDLSSMDDTVGCPAPALNCLDLPQDLSFNCLDLPQDLFFNCLDRNLRRFLSRRRKV